MLGLLSLEVSFKQIKLIILSDAPSGASDEVFSGLGETEMRLLIESTHVFGHISCLFDVKACWPTTDYVFHALILGGNSFGVDLNSNTMIRI